MVFFAKFGDMLVLLAVSAERCLLFHWMVLPAWVADPGRRCPRSNVAKAQPLHITRLLSMLLFLSFVSLERPYVFALLILFYFLDTVLSTSPKPDRRPSLNMRK